MRAVWEALKPVSTDVGYFDLCDAHDLDSHWGHPRLFGLFRSRGHKTGKDTLKYLQTTYKVEWKEWSQIAKGAAVELFWGAALGLVDIGVKGITPHFELGLCGNFRAKLNAFEGDGLYRSPKMSGRGHAGPSSEDYRCVLFFVATKTTRKALRATRAT